MIIDNTKYFLFINENNNLTNCQKKMLIDYKNNLNKIYLDRKSDKQIQTLLLYCYQNNLVTKIAKIKTLFYAFFDKEFTEQLINKILSEKTPDIKIINYILEIKKNKNILPERKYSGICDSWTYILELMGKIFNKFTDSNTNQNIKYLDLGCGSGNKTIKFSSILGLNISNVFGADISNWGPYNQKKYTHKFNFIQIDSDHINTTTNSVDLCSCILMLHHVKNLDNLLLDIKRVLKPGGILMVIEHNNYDDLDNLTLDVLHMLYGYLYDKNNRYLANPDYAQYHNWVEWNYILSTHNFQILESNSLFTELTNEIRYDNIFYSFYKNIK